MSIARSASKTLQNRVVCPEKPPGPMEQQKTELLLPISWQQATKFHDNMQIRSSHALGLKPNFQFGVPDRHFCQAAGEEPTLMIEILK
jgi:hypothetical protein